jgi:hypothetical protein
MRPPLILNVAIFDVKRYKELRLSVRFPTVRRASVLGHTHQRDSIPANIRIRR